MIYDKMSKVLGEMLDTPARKVTSKVLRDWVKRLTKTKMWELTEGLVRSTYVLERVRDGLPEESRYRLLLDQQIKHNEEVFEKEESVTNCNLLNPEIKDVLKFVLDVIEKYYAQESSAKTALFRIYGCVGITLKEIERKENENS